MKPSLNEWPIPTWTTAEELAYLASLARKSDHAIEVGTYMGASARRMLESSASLKLTCVDDFKVFGTKQITEMFLHDWINGSRCLIIPFESPRAAESLFYMIGRFDFGFIDDGHAEEDLRRDIGAVLPLIRSGGALVFHDWEGDNNVARGIKSMLPANELTFPVGRLAQYIKP